MKSHWTERDIQRHRSNELRVMRFTLNHSRTNSATHASQADRSAAAEKPLPLYVPRTNHNGQGNTGRVWSF